MDEHAPEQPKSPDHHCFGCGAANPVGLRLRFEREADGAGLVAVRTTVCLGRNFEGPRGYIHGGILATLFDEAMSKLNRPLGVLAMTRNLNVDYRRPAPLEQALLLRAWHLRREGRKLFHAAELQAANGTLLAHADGLFIVLPAA